LFWSKFQINPEKADTYSMEILQGDMVLQSAYARRGMVLENLARFSESHTVYNEGYNYNLRDKLGSGKSNDPEFVIRFCCSSFQAGMTDLQFVNELLFFVQQKYPFLTPLRELTSSTATGGEWGSK
jgi:hypothetical protein